MSGAGEGTASNPEALDAPVSEIDAFVIQAKLDFVSNNITSLLDAGASPNLLFAKLSSDELVANVAEFLASGIEQDVILDKIGALDAIRANEKLTAAGIVFDPNWVLAAIREWTETRGFIPYDSLITHVDFLLAIGVKADDIYELIMMDDHFGGLLIEVVKRLKDAGANIPIDVLNKAVEQVEANPNNRYSDMVLKNLVDLTELGVDVRPQEIVERYLEGNGSHGTSTLLVNVRQLRAVLPDIDLAVLVEGSGTFAVDNKFDYLMKSGVDPRVVAAHISSEKLEERMPDLIRAFKQNGYSVDPLIERQHYFDRFLDQLEQFLDAGASHDVILKKVTGFGVLRNLDRLLRNNFTFDELLPLLSPEEKIENYKQLSAAGAELDLNQAIDEILDKDEYELRSFPDAYKRAAKFLLKNLPTLQKGGADITKITSKEELREILEETMTDEQKLQFTLARFKYESVDRG